jgi:hypothetical protein
MKRKARQDIASGGLNKNENRRLKDQASILFISVH